MILLIVIAEPLFRLLYTEKWIASVPYFQIACVGGMLMCSHQINQSIMLALGKSALRFWVGLIKRVMELTLIFIGIKQNGLIGMIVLGVALSSYFSFLINALYVSKIFPYTMIEQVKDMLPTFILAVAIGSLEFLFSKYLIVNDIVKILIQVVIYSVAYLSLASILKFEAFSIYSNELKTYFGNFKQRRRDK
jgi:O-antigen/teichoic acid export membrane protein